MMGYDKALQAEIEAQLALQSKKKIKPPKTPKSTIDYAKQYTKILTELEEKQASLIADGQSIQLYGTTSSFNEYTSALADIKQNKDKFDAILKIDPNAIETIKEKRKPLMIWRVPIRSRNLLMIAVKKLSRCNLKLP